MMMLAKLLAGAFVFFYVSLFGFGILGPLYFYILGFLVVFVILVKIGKAV